MKPRPPKRRVDKARGVPPPEVPEVSATPSAPPEDKQDPVPDHIRKMLEAAYT